MSETNPESAPHSIEQPDEPFVRMDETRAQELERESHNSLYLKVWGGLAIFTAVEYGYAHLSKDAFFWLVLGLLVLAAIKAAMVGWYFMHLKFEGKWVFAPIIPPCVLAVILVVALYPDMGMPPLDEQQPTDDSAESAWVEPAASPRLFTA